MKQLLKKPYLMIAHISELLNIFTLTRNIFSLSKTVGEDTFTSKKDSLSEEETTALLDFSFYAHAVYSRILVHGIRTYSCFWNKACGKQRQLNN